MGRRGQGERGNLSISDAMPALTGSRCVGTGMSGRIFRQTRWYRRIDILSLFPQGNKDFFIGR